MSRGQNKTAAIKAESDICCISANAINVVNSVEDKEIIFILDKTLGALYLFILIKRYISGPDFAMFMMTSVRKIYRN